MRAMMKTAVLAMSLAGSGPVLAVGVPDALTGLAVFGDSLSDPGNVFAATGGAFPPPPYFMGRFSNSFNYADLLADDFADSGKPSLNFAFGGARTENVGPGPFPITPPDLEEQRQAFASLPSGVLGSRPLAMIFIGANDLLQAAIGFPVDPAASVARAIGAADAIAEQIALFDASVVRDFAVLSVGDIGQTPRFSAPSFPDGSGGSTFNPLFPLRGVSSMLSGLFDARLAGQLDLLRLSGVSVLGIDSAGEYENILADPSAYGITETMIGCGVLSGVVNGFPQNDFTRTGCDVSDPASVAQFFWWDDVHFTSTVHDQLAGLALRTISAAYAPVPLPGALLAGGLAALVLLRRRDAGGAATI